MTLTLTGAIDATQNNVQLSGDLDAQPGDLFRLDDELVEFGAFLAVDRQHAVSRSLCSFGRGVDGTAAASHTAGTEVLGAVEAVESGTTSVIPDPFPSGGGGGGGIDTVTDGLVTVTPATDLTIRGMSISDDGGGALTLDARSAQGASNLGDGGAFSVQDASGNGDGGPAILQGGGGDTGGTGGYAVLQGGQGNLFTTNGSFVRARGGTSTDTGILEISTGTGASGSGTQFLGSDGANGVVWRDPAAFVDPTTATPEDICNALIAAGLMAPS